MPELLLLDNGGVMNSETYKRHLNTIKYYNKMVENLKTQRAGSTEYLKTTAKLRQIQGYIDRDLKEAGAVKEN